GVGRTNSRGAARPAQLFGSAGETAGARRKGACPARRRGSALRLHPHRQARDRAQKRSTAYAVDVLCWVGGAGGGGTAAINGNEIIQRRIGSDCKPDRTGEKGRLTMTFAVALILKSTALLAGAWIASRLLRQASASTRHLLWIAVIAAVLLLPLASWI